MTKEGRFNDFISRADEMGLQNGVDFTIEDGIDTETGNKLDFKTFKVNQDRFKGNLPGQLKCFYALLGLAYHFESRDWATNLSWVYIIKSRFMITFMESTEKYLTNKSKNWTP